ncbi:hypothetical protein [Streptomyces sp. NPDC017435]|uniref:GHMP family kinase ATP-binding protein n=1 Tax=Streptomyces sp. NPDC017435 TaxID=3364995 RepID=UPI00378A6D3D
MALDSSKIVPNQGAYLAGELLFACDLMRRVEVDIVDDGPAGQTTPDCDHPVLARHAGLLMRTALGTHERLRVRVSAPNLPAHLGLGSSSGQIAAVAAAVNELYGRPVAACQLDRSRRRRAPRPHCCPFTRSCLSRYHRGVRGRVPKGPDPLLPGLS